MKFGKKKLQSALIDDLDTSKGQSAFHNSLKYTYMLGSDLRATMKKTIKKESKNLISSKPKKE